MKSLPLRVLGAIVVSTWLASQAAAELTHRQPGLLTAQFAGIARKTGQVYLIHPKDKGGLVKIITRREVEICRCEIDPDFTLASVPFVHHGAVCQVVSSRRPGNYYELAYGVDGKIRQSPISEISDYDRQLNPERHRKIVDAMMASGWIPTVSRGQHLRDPSVLVHTAKINARDLFGDIFGCSENYKLFVFAHRSLTELLIVTHDTHGRWEISNVTENIQTQLTSEDKKLYEWDLKALEFSGSTVKLGVIWGEAGPGAQAATITLTRQRTGWKASVKKDDLLIEHLREF